MIDMKGVSLGTPDDASQTLIGKTVRITTSFKNGAWVETMMVVARVGLPTTGDAQVKEPPMLAVWERGSKQPAFIWWCSTITFFEN